MKKFLQEIDTYLQELTSNNPFDYYGLQKYNIKVPILRDVIKKKTFSIHQFEVEKQVEIWNHIWNNTIYFETKSLAIYPFQHKSLTKREFNTLIHWVDKCVCWEHSDDLSKIYAQVLEENPHWIIPYYKKWNQSENLWKRRQSIVGLLEYASKRKKVLPFVELISFVKPLLNDPEYYVQKGIGWTIREIYNIYPNETLTFIENNLIRISPIAYSAATEKISKAAKEKLNNLRKVHRVARNKTL